MRHNTVTKRLGRQTGHRQALIRNMTTSFLRYEKIKTTETKAKIINGVAEKMITLARRGDLAARRQVLTIVQDKDVVQKLFDVIAARYSNRQATDSGGRGGYTRILKLGPRHGDAAPMVLLELV